MTKKLYCIAGASGTGKTTLLEYVKKNFAINVTEVSARPYLPDKTDYVNSLTKDSQVLITQNRFVSFIEKIVKPVPTLFSRSPADSLAYEMVLNKAPFLKKLLERQVKITKPLIQYLYVPTEFDMEDEEDTIRGTNSKVRDETDLALCQIFNFFDIETIVIKGKKEERYKILDEIFEGYKYE